MAETIQCLSGNEQLKTAPVFGVRHLSPASAWHLLAYLEQIRPRCVLIEGPSDGNEFLAHLADRNVKPPVALLAYTTQLPVRTVLYPFAAYSPEYQAIRWAIDNHAEVRFIDLPTSASIGADRWHEPAPPEDKEQKNPEDEDKKNPEEDKKNPKDEEQKNPKDEDKKNPKDEDKKNLEHADQENQKDEAPNPDARVNYNTVQARFYEDIVRLSEEPDYDTFWERHFEHCLETDVFMEKIAAFSGTMRGSLEDLQWETEARDAAYNRVREAYMKRQIARAESDGFPRETIVVVTGSYHVSGLSDDSIPPMTDAEYACLPAAEAKLTLMPYSYYRLSSRSGYGAGNKAPAYFQLMWECTRSGDISQLASLYMASLGSRVRESGNYNSTASVIEAVRLAGSLAYMHGGGFPTLKDLHDAAVCLLGNGEQAAVAEAIARVDIGTAIGELPEGVSQTPVQDDMNRQLKRLKLEKYKSVVARDIELDLRENRHVQSKESAFLDLNRSIFLHRLRLLGIGFAVYNGAGPSAWGEKWILQWTPENEIEVVETTLKGETIVNAAAFVLKEQLDAAGTILQIAGLLRQAFICRLPEEVPGGLLRLQTLCVEGENFAEAAYTAGEIANILQFRDVRNIDTAPLLPILQQVFLRAVLVLFDGAGCDDSAADELIKAMEVMHRVSQEQFEAVNDELWLRKLRELADSDNRNPKISGAAAAIMMERGAIDDGDVKAEVTRRLSAGVPGDLAALWFEGLCARNRWVLLSRIGIWKQLDGYLDTLDDKEFKRALVFLRRAFSAFEPQEKNAITEILADLWNIDAAGVGEYLQEELSEEDASGLAELNDFDFDF